MMTDDASDYGIKLRRRLVPQVRPFAAAAMAIDSRLRDAGGFPSNELVPSLSPPHVAVAVLCEPPAEFTYQADARP